jgi:polyphosphate kinase
MVTSADKKDAMDQVKFDLADPKLYVNRELSLLEFQARVLEEAVDEGNPLLERAKFLAIVGSNMDEFFMVRVGGLKMQIDAGVVDFSIDGLTPAEQLAAIRKVAHQLLIDSRTCYTQILPLLNEAGVHVLDYEALTEKQQENTRSYFEEVIFPVLTPLAFDPGHPFPHISNLSLNLAILIKDKLGQKRFARVKVPATLPRLVPIKRSSGSVRKDGTVPHHHYFVWIEQVIASNLDTLFPGMEILETHPFRVTRNADLEIQELEADDLLETMELNVRERRFGDVVRLAINNDMPQDIRNILVHNLEMDPNDVYPLDGPLGFSGLWSLYGVDRYDLKDKSFLPATPPPLESETHDGNIFATIRQNNILLHHPYDSFNPVVDFIKAASHDPNVLAIKQCLYRVGKNSPVVKALLDARREYGKQVAVLVELKARFDEEPNIGWARMLEREGVHVIYGLLGLKTHSKILLVVRKEGERIRRYVHLGTGNYNHITANLYEDIGYFTCDDDIGADATDLFNYLTGYSNKEEYRKLLVAPINLRSRMEELIDREIEHAQNGEEAHIIFKMNSLADKSMVKRLYQASQAGVKIDLIVRGICCLRPGVTGLSENIQVLSIVGRFLEHSRVYYFFNAGDEELYMGSADLMPRNLNRRVEVVFPIEDAELIRYLRDDIFATYLVDNVKARWMTPDGSYIRRNSNPNGPPINSQEKFIQSRSH